MRLNDVDDKLLHDPCVAELEDATVDDDVIVEDDVVLDDDIFPDDVLTVDFDLVTRLGVDADSTLLIRFFIAAIGRLYRLTALEQVTTLSIFYF